MMWVASAGPLWKWLTRTWTTNSMVVKSSLWSSTFHLRGRRVFRRSSTANSSSRSKLSSQCCAMPREVCAGGRGRQGRGGYSDRFDRWIGRRDESDIALLRYLHRALEALRHPLEGTPEVVRPLSTSDSGGPQDSLPGVRDMVLHRGAVVGCRTYGTRLGFQAISIPAVTIRRKM